MKTIIIALLAAIVFILAACSDPIKNYEAPPVTGDPVSDPPFIPVNRTPVASDFYIDNLTQGLGNTIPVTITPKPGKSSGQITIYYAEVEGSRTYAETTTFPTRIGTYKVTFDVAAAEGWFEAKNLSGGTLKISEVSPTPVADDFDIGNLTQTVGYVTPVTITRKPGKSNGMVTIFYDGSETLPTAAGTYTVTFDVAAAYASVWNAANGLAGGTLVINQLPVADDFYVGNLNQIAGSVTPVTVTPKPGKSGGAITVLYNGNTDIPQTAGTYTVYFNVAAAEGWGEVYGLVAGTLKIATLSEILIYFDMDEWGLTEQTVQATANADKIFTVTGTFAAYRWYLDGAQVGTSSSYTFNKPAGAYQLMVVVTNSAGESRSARYWITVSPSLAENVWANGTLTGADGEDWYLVSVSSGTTYYIWWDDRKQGNGNKSGDVAVSARYVGQNSWIFGGTDTEVDSSWKWESLQSFTASQTGMVYIRVIPYNRIGSNAGTYGIAYNTSGTIPAYSVTFNTNGGSGTTPAAQTIYSGYSITLPGGSGLSRSGYTFGGWNTAANGTGTNYNADSSYTPTAHITLYARWYTNYTVTFNVNGGSGTAPAAQTAAPSITLPDGSGLSRSGYIFGGWYDNGTVTTYAAGATYTPTANTTLYAKWDIPVTPLTSGVWANGSLSSEPYEVRYSFPVTSGLTYRIWWNDYYQGNGTKTLDVRVSAQYSNENPDLYIFYSVDSGYNTAVGLTADRTGTVYLIVRPSSSSSTGTFGIVYSAGTTRPGL